MKVYGVENFGSDNLIGVGGLCDSEVYTCVWCVCVVCAGSVVCVCIRVGDCTRDGSWSTTHGCRQ